MMPLAFERGAGWAREAIVFVTESALGRRTPLLRGHRHKPRL